MNKVIDEENELDDFIKIRSIDDVHERLMSKIIQVKKGDKDLVYRYLSNLNETELTTK